MIISDKHQLIFITTPKSGSHTGFELMSKYFDAKPVSFNHSRYTPSHLKHYHTFSFVRNPYERFCALYHACVINHDKHWVPQSARESILHYALWYMNMAKVNSYTRFDLTSPQWFWHKNTQVDTFIQIENAQDYFDKHFPELDIQMPHELKREHPTWEDVKTPHLTEAVNSWATKDFNLYEYEREDNNS